MRSRRWITCYRGARPGSCCSSHSGRPRHEALLFHHGLEHLVVMPSDDSRPPEDKSGDLGDAGFLGGRESFQRPFEVGLMAERPLHFLSVQPSLLGRFLKRRRESDVFAPNPERIEDSRLEGQSEAVVLRKFERLKCEEAELQFVREVHPGGSLRRHLLEPFGRGLAAIRIHGDRRSCRRNFGVKPVRTPQRLHVVVAYQLIDPLLRDVAIGADEIREDYHSRRRRNAIYVRLVRHVTCLVRLKCPRHRLGRGQRQSLAGEAALERVLVKRKKYQRRTFRAGPKWRRPLVAFYIAEPGRTQGVAFHHDGTFEHHFVASPGWHIEREHYAGGVLHHHSFGPKRMRDENFPARTLE